MAKVRMFLLVMALFFYLVCLGKSTPSNDSLSTDHNFGSKLSGMNDRPLSGISKMQYGINFIDYSSHSKNLDIEEVRKLMKTIDQYMIEKITTSGLCNIKIWLCFNMLERIKKVKAFRGRVEKVTSRNAEKLLRDLREFFKSDILISKPNYPCCWDWYWHAVKSVL